MATVVNSNPHGPADLVRLAAFEAHLGAVLPADYRQFLLAHNGGDFLPDQIILPGRSEPYAAIGSAFGLYDGPYALETVFRNVVGEVPADLLPFAEDAGGNLFCVGIRGAHYGRIYYWDHELSTPGAEEPGWNNLTLLAGSFGTFVAALGGPQPGNG